MKPIAEQAAERGTPMTELLGKNAHDIRALGFDVPPSVPDHMVLGADESDRPVDLHAFGRPTGYVWTGYVRSGSHQTRVDHASEEMAREIDREVLGSLFAVASPEAPEDEVFPREGQPVAPILSLLRTPKE